MSNKIISLVATIQCYQKSQDSDQAPNNLAVVWQFLRDEHVIDLYGYLIKDNRIQHIRLMTDFAGTKKAGGGMLKSLEEKILNDDLQ